MKLKENKEISLYNKIPLIFFLCCAVTVVLRTVQMFFFIEREAGFYTGGNLIKVLLYVLIAVASLAFAFVAFLSKETAQVSLRMKKDTGLSALAALVSVSFLYDSLTAFAGSATSVGTASYGATAFQSMMLSGSIPQFFQGIFALLSALYFLFFAKGIIKGTHSAAKHRILAVAPVGWAGFRLIFRFVEQISYIRVSELLLELVLLALFVMFFMAFAQLSSGVYVKNSRWRMTGIGLPAALISLTVNVPRILFAVIKGTDALYSKYPFKVCDFVLALFIAVLVVKLIRKENEVEPYEA